MAVVVSVDKMTDKQREERMDAYIKQIQAVRVRAEGVVQDLLRIEQEHSRKPR